MRCRRTTGLVLAAGGSKRLGQPKQLLAYHGGTLLGHVLDTARACRFDQLLCVVNDRVAGVDFENVQVVVNPQFGEGCSSSIAAALNAVDRCSDMLVLMLGDQPGVTAETVAALLAGRDDAPLAVCRYEDGRGHPVAIAREMFGELASLHGDKGVWRLVDRFAIDVPVDGPIPRDVDTWEDYETVLSS
jgi:molybdenum cofactor cytidylyltransferase